MSCRSPRRPRRAIRTVRTIWPVRPVRPVRAIRARAGCRSGCAGTVSRTGIAGCTGDIRRDAGRARPRGTTRDRFARFGWHVGLRPSRAGAGRTGGGRQLLRRIGVGLMGRWRRNGLGPGCEFVLLVKKIADVALGVLELRSPEERVERTDLDADPAVHAQGEVDREAVERVAGAGTAALGGGEGLLVGVDVDAPVGTLAGAEHAHRAVLFDQPDHSPATGRKLRLHLGVLLGHRSTQHVAKGDG